MNKNPLNKGILIENASGIGTVTPEMVEARASELAVIAGRVPPQPSQVDYEQAKRELTGEPDTDVQEAALELIPESERWNPVPGSKGRHTPESFGEDEDSEGRSESAQLVEEGIEEAEHDQMLQAARAARKETNANGEFNHDRESGHSTTSAMAAISIPTKRTFVENPDMLASG